MGVALLGGFGDLNVDRSTREGDPSPKTRDRAAGVGVGATPNSTGTSTALTLQPGELLKLRVPELKKKLVEAGVDLAKYPGAVEKKVGVCWVDGTFSFCLAIAVLAYRFFY